jgi:hypothetical protein
MANHSQCRADCALAPLPRASCKKSDDHENGGHKNTVRDDFGSDRRRRVKKLRLLGNRGRVRNPLTEQRERSNADLSAGPPGPSDAAPEPVETASGRPPVLNQGSHEVAGPGPPRLKRPSPSWEAAVVLLSVDPGRAPRDNLVSRHHARQQGVSG